MQKELEKSVRSIILELLDRRSLTVEEILKIIQIKYKLKKYEILKIINDLIDEGYLSKVNTNVPNSFLGYIRSSYSLWFWSIIFITIVTFSTIFYMPQIYPLIYLRYIFSSIFVFFLPGYVIIETIYPKFDELTGIERFALSVAFSVGIVALEGFILNYTPWGIRLEPVVAAIILTTLAFSIFSIFRKLSYLRLLKKAQDQK